MQSHGVRGSPGIVRKRSTSRLDGARHGDVKHGSPGGRPGGSERLPPWLVTLLLVASLLLLLGALRLTHPRVRADASHDLGSAAKKQQQQQQQGGSHIGKQHHHRCYALEDAETARLLGAQNRVVNRSIATAVPRAATLFNLGLLALHGFNQLAASAMFEACLRADPGCAMCHWGLAYAQGPMPNKVPGRLGSPYPTFHAAAATDALHHVSAAQRAHAAALATLGGGASGQYGADVARRDGLLIGALAQRFGDGGGAVKGGRWRVAEARYAATMAALAEQEQDADAFALAAEAHMNLSPWDYYHANGSLRATAAAAEALLHKALALAPSHPHALHLHIHIAEAGAPVAAPGAEHTSAGRALGSADALAALRPADGHLLHMPSHVYVRTGRYARAVAVNRAAYDADVARGGLCLTPYLPEHNVHMLVWAASMAGMFHTAEAFATGMRDLRSRLPDTWMAGGTEWVSLPLLHIRYGEWPRLLAMPPPPKDARGVTSLGGRQFAAVVYHAGRTLALAARAQAAAAALLGVDDRTAFELASKSLRLREREVAQEQQQLQVALSLMPFEPATQPGAPPGMYASAYSSLGQLLAALAGARVQLMRNSSAAAAAGLADGLALEDELGYMEPPRVHQPLRQCMGWLLLASGRHDEARRVYSQDLARHPDNGWSLLGMKQLAEATGSRLAAAGEAFAAAWAGAEVAIESSCPALSRAFVL